MAKKNAKSVVAKADCLISTKEVCEIMGVGHSFVSKLAKDGKIRAFKIGMGLKFYRSDVDNYIRSCMV